MEPVFTCYIKKCTEWQLLVIEQRKPEKQTMKKKPLPLLEWELIASLFPLLFYRVMLFAHPTFLPVRLPSGRSLTSLTICVTRWLLLLRTNTDCFRLINQHIPWLHVRRNLSLHWIIGWTAGGFLIGGKITHDPSRFIIYLFFWCWLLLSYEPKIIVWRAESHLKNLDWALKCSGLAGIIIISQTF